MSALNGHTVLRIITIMVRSFRVSEAPTASLFMAHCSKTELTIRAVGSQLTGKQNLIKLTTLRSVVDLRVILRMCKTRQALISASNETIIWWSLAPLMYRILILLYGSSIWFVYGNQLSILNEKMILLTGKQTWWAVHQRTWMSTGPLSKVLSSPNDKVGHVPKGLTAGEFVGGRRRPSSRLQWRVLVLSATIRRP